MFHRVLAPLACCAVSTLATAQVVRGAITERASDAPLAGVLVTLEPLAAGHDPAAVLTSEKGEFRVRAPGPGRYLLTAKRIGVRRFVSDPIELHDGETRHMDITLDPVALLLPEVRVAEFDLCVPQPTDRPRVEALWDEARTALAAAQVSLRDRLFDGQLRRYSRGLDPRTLRVLEESWSAVQGVMDRPLVSLTGDSLSKTGYHRTVDGYTYFYAPDAAVLLSDAFRRDHCYAAVQGGGNRRGLLGLAFQPAAERLLPDVRGTLWLDARSFELRLVEFRFTEVAPFPGSDKVGGEVHFEKLDNGAWMTSRWFLRVPQQSRPASPVDAETRLPSVIVRPTMHRLIEEGGLVESARPRKAG